jgi:hypothetical protein
MPLVVEVVIDLTVITDKFLNDEPKTLSYQITLFGPIGADVRH